MVNLDTSKQEFEKIFEHLRTELASLRGTRATPALIDEIQIEAYGARQPLKALASISVPDPRTLRIEPWDKSIVKDIERGIAGSGKGLNPVSEGNILRIALPPLTEESRKELVKIVHDKLEEARRRVRTARDALRQSIQAAEKKKEISEDDKFKQLKKLDELVGDYNEKIKGIGEAKEKEIMTV